jgi:hypothetical protein
VLLDPPCSRYQLPSHSFCPASYSQLFSPSFSFSPESGFCHDLCSFPLTFLFWFYLLSSRFVLLPLLPLLLILLTYSFLSSSFLLLYSPQVRPSFLISFALSLPFLVLLPSLLSPRRLHLPRAFATLYSS